MKPLIRYFELRGRGEVLKLALAAKDVEFDVSPGGIDYQAMKTDTVHFPFAQAPGYSDDDGNMGQSNAILRHIGRKYDMYGSTLGLAAVVDQLLDGVEDLRRKYLDLVYKQELADEAKVAYWETHADPANTAARNGGAHFAYLEAFVAGPFALGDTLSIADIALFDIFDLHQRIYGEEKLKAAYPKLAGVYAAVAALPGVAAYLASPLRLEKINGNNMG